MTIESIVGLINRFEATEGKRPKQIITTPEIHRRIYDLIDGFIVPPVKYDGRKRMVIMGIPVRRNRKVPKEHLIVC